MTDFEYDNLPDELNVDPVPDELFDEAFAALVQALNSEQCGAHEAKAVYVYDRKGYLETGPLDGSRRNSHQTDSDDVVLQVTVRVPNPRHRATLHRVMDLVNVVTSHRLQAERERLVAEITADNMAISRLVEGAAQKREKLRTLGETK